MLRNGLYCLFATKYVQERILTKYITPLASSRQTTTTLAKEIFKNNPFPQSLDEEIYVADLWPLRLPNKAVNENETGSILESVCFGKCPLSDESPLKCLVGYYPRTLGIDLST